MAESVSIRCSNSQHAKCPNCGCKCHVMLAVGRSVRVINIQSPFYQWVGKLDERLESDYWKGSYLVSAAGLSLNLTFSEKELELMGK